MEKYYLDVEHFHSLQAQNQSTVAWWECWSTCRKSGGSSWRKRGFWRTSSAERKWRGHNHYVFFGISTSLFQTTSKLIRVQSYWSIRLTPSKIEFQRGKTHSMRNNEQKKPHELFDFTLWEWNSSVISILLRLWNTFIQMTIFPWLHMKFWQRRILRETATAVFLH